VICYFDTSAFVPLLIEESASAFCARIWVDSDSVITTRLLYVETAAALAQGQRTGRISVAEYRAALRGLDRHWADFDVVEADETLIARAAELTGMVALRGYDAVHCAAAEQVDEGDLVLASGVRQLLTAAASLGIPIADTNDS